MAYTFITAHRITCIMLIVATFSGSAIAKPEYSRFAEEDQEISSLIYKTLPAVYHVTATLTLKDTKTGKVLGVNESSASGFTISRDGLLMTNAHVLQKDEPNGDTPKFIAPATFQYANGVTITGTYEAISSIGTVHTLTIVALHQDPNIDLAILRLSPNPQGDQATFLNFAEDVSYDHVVSIGSPFGFSFSVSRGMVNNPHATFEGRTFIQTDAMVHPGSSGGPLIRLRDGKVLGVIAKTFMPFEGLRYGVGIGLAVPSSIAAAFAKEIIPKYSAK